MIKAVIFDMDGLLIDSEPYWQKSEIEIFSGLGILLTKEMCMETMGLRIDEVIKHWYDKSPWKTQSIQEVERKVLSTLKQNIIDHAGAMEGVEYILNFFCERKIKIALASSSPFEVIHTVINKLKINPYFQAIHSAEKEDYGKPHPAIYISTAKQLGIPPVECLAFEDSFNGILSAKSARMKVVAIPEISQWHQTRFDIADVKLKSLFEFNDQHLNSFN